LAPLVQAPPAQAAAPPPPPAVPTRTPFTGASGLTTQPGPLAWFQWDGAGQLPPQHQQQLLPQQQQLLPQQQQQQQQQQHQHQHHQQQQQQPQYQCQQPYQQPMQEMMPDGWQSGYIVMVAIPAQSAFGMASPSFELTGQPAQHAEACMPQWDGYCAMQQPALQWCHDAEARWSPHDAWDAACHQEGHCGVARGTKMGGPRLPRKQHTRQQRSEQPQQQRQSQSGLPEPGSSGMSAEIVDFWRAQLRLGGDAAAVALAVLQEPGLVPCLAFEPAGCYLVQAALAAADQEVATELALQMRGWVFAAVMSRHGNYVIQKMITTLTVQQVDFVIHELMEVSSKLAGHEYGCRIFCRLLEHAAQDDLVVRLLDRVLDEVEDMVVHPFGHHVIERIFEHGRPHQQGWIVDALRWNLLRVARDRFGAYVLEKALLCGSFEDKEALTSAFLACSAAEVASLSRRHLGCMVLRAVQRLPAPLAEQAREHLGTPAARQELADTRRGRHFLGGRGAAAGSSREALEAPTAKVSDSGSTREGSEPAASEAPSEPVSDAE